MLAESFVERSERERGGEIVVLKTSAGSLTVPANEDLVEGGGVAGDGFS